MIKTKKVPARIEIRRKIELSDAQVMAYFIGCCAQGFLASNAPLPGSDSERFLGEDEIVDYAVQMGNELFEKWEDWKKVKRLEEKVGKNVG
jgi:hypothetical protein